MEDTILMDNLHLIDEDGYLIREMCIRDSFYVLSRLLKVHMEDLLVPQCESIREVEMCVCISSYKRLSLIHI